VRTSASRSVTPPPRIPTAAPCLRSHLALCGLRNLQAPISGGRGFDAPGPGVPWRRHAHDHVDLGDHCARITSAPCRVLLLTFIHHHTAPEIVLLAGPVSILSFTLTISRSYTSSILRTDLSRYDSKTANSVFVEQRFIDIHDCIK